MCLTHAACPAADSDAFIYAHKKAKQGNGASQTPPRLPLHEGLLMQQGVSPCIHRSDVAAVTRRCSGAAAVVTLVHHENMTSSRKPEVHNVSQCRQKRTEPRHRKHALHIEQELGAIYLLEMTKGLTGIFGKGLP